MGLHHCPLTVTDLQPLRRPTLTTQTIPMVMWTPQSDEITPILGLQIPSVLFINADGGSVLIGRIQALSVNVGSNLRARRGCGLGKIATEAYLDLSRSMCVDQTSSEVSSLDGWVRTFSMTRMLKGLSPGKDGDPFSNEARHYCAGLSNALISCEQVYKFKPFEDRSSQRWYLWHTSTRLLYAEMKSHSVENKLNFPTKRQIDISIYSPNRCPLQDTTNSSRCEWT